MSGHNKWSKVKNKKAVTDAKKGKIYTKMAKAISVEVKKANGDVNASSVQAVVRKAREYNVPNDNIERALKKYKKKYEKTNVMKQLRSRKEFQKPSIVRRQEVIRAAYKQRMQSDLI